MTISCPKCAAEIDTTSADVALQATRCKRCRRLVDLSKHLATAPAIGGVRESSGSAPVAVQSGGARASVPMPPRFKLEHGANLKITWRWFGPQFLFLVFFCIFWDGFLLVWYSVAIGAMLSGAGGGGAVMVLFPLLHVAVGVALTYYTVCGFVNSTVIEAGSGRLTVKHGPLPWRGNLDIEASTLEQLYGEEIVHRGKNGNVSRTYDVSAVDRDGVARKIVKGLPEAAQALFLEQALESQLSISDRPVGGELPRT